MPGNQFWKHSQKVVIPPTSMFVFILLIAEFAGGLGAKLLQMLTRLQFFFVLICATM